MAFTVTSVELDQPFASQSRNADLQRGHATATGPASYTTGGEAVTIADYGVADFVVLNFEAFSTGAAEYALSYDRTNALIQAWTDYPGGTEVTSTTDLSALTFRMSFLATSLVTSGT